jgi:hypothetical protein
MGPESLRSQVEVIRDCMLSASDCDTWLTLHEIAELTRFGEASISAQLRHLRKPMFGGYRVEKRRREVMGSFVVLRRVRGGAEWPVATTPTLANSDTTEFLGRGFGCDPGKWEYRVARAV